MKKKCFYLLSGFLTWIFPSWHLNQFVFELILKSDSDSLQLSVAGNIRLAWNYFILHYIPILGFSLLIRLRDPILAFLVAIVENCH